MKTEYGVKAGNLSEDSGISDNKTSASSVSHREVDETESRVTLERILSMQNLWIAYRRVKANKGAPGIDNMSVGEFAGWFNENGDEWIASITNGTYKPQPVRRAEIRKDNGGIRKLGIPTVKDRVLQQAISQILTPLYEGILAECCYAYRPQRGARQAMERVMDSICEGYEYACVLDLSQYFDTLNHEMLMNMLRKDIKDDRIIQLIKKYLKSGVMVNGVKHKTEEGSPQGGNLSPLLANIYLTPFDKEFESRGVRIVRYADDILILAKSQRAAERLLRNSMTYLEAKLKLKVNHEKSKAINVFDGARFKFLGFTVGKREGNPVLRAHPKSIRKLKGKLKELTGRSKGRGARQIIAKVTEMARGWIGYYQIAVLEDILAGIDSWVRSRIRMCIWKQWKNMRTRIDALLKLGCSKRQALRWGKSQKGYWRIAHSPILTMTVTNDILRRVGYKGLMDFWEDSVNHA